MTRRFYLLVMTASIVLADGATAGILFNRKPKPSPQRAQELLTTLLSDGSESKRAAAASELGDYDGTAFPEIVPALLQALRDSGADVRASAVASLGKLRPVTQEVGQALEQALAGDSSIKVRLQARTTLWGYSAAGYRAGKDSAGKPAAASKPIERPAVARPLPQPLPAAPVVSQPLPTAPVQQEPPLADPLPAKPATGRLVPVVTPQLQAPTPSVPQRLPATAPVAPPVVAPPVDQGPMLNPPM